MTTSLHDLFAQRMEGSLAAMTALRAPPLMQCMIDMAQAMRDSLARGGTLYTCGNGGSAAQAMHLAEELIGRYRSSRPPFRAICLNADPTALTCIANDFGFEQVFARQCEALLSERDVLIAFSTSGNSENVMAALRAARSRRATAIGLLGRDGGRCAELCDHALIVPAHDSAHVQEAHQVALHLLCEAMEPPG
jgi:D-sedoheptulose 7-phosphate isomerase